VVLSFGAPSRAFAAGEIYRCMPLDLLHLTDEGTLGRYPDDSAFRDFYSGMLVDTTTGAVRNRSKVTQWRVVQRGSEENDFVAVLGSGDASSATDFIRIRAWKTQPKVTFLVFSLSLIVTGTCAALN
jgi:hypothetical protein